MFRETIATDPTAYRAARISCSQSTAVKDTVKTVKTCHATGMNIVLFTIVYSTYE